MCIHSNEGTCHPVQWLTDVFMPSSTEEVSMSEFGGAHNACLFDQFIFDFGSLIGVLVVGKM